MSRVAHSSDRPRRAVTPVVSLELCQGMVRGEPEWSVVVSVPNREGTLAWSYGRYPDRLDKGALDDLAARVTQLVTQVIVMGKGIQEVLPFD